MGDPTLELIARLQSMQGNTGKPGAVFGMLPDASVGDGLSATVCGVGKNPLNTPVASLLAGGGWRKPGKQALISQIAASMMSDFQQAKNAGEAYRAQLAAGVEAAAHGLPPRPTGGGSREV